MRKLLANERRRGENNFYLEVDGAVVGRVTVPQGRDTMKFRTFKSACEQAGLTLEQMHETYRCTFGRADYEALIRGKPQLH